MFKKLYNKIIIPVIAFLLPGMTLRKLLIALGAGLVASVIFYLWVNPLVNNKTWQVLLAGFGAVFLGVLFTRTIAAIISNYACHRKEVLTAIAKEKTKNKDR